MSLDPQQQPPSYYPPPPPQQYVPVVAVAPSSTAATVSIMAGIAGVFLFCLVVPSVVAVVAGHVAWKEVHERNIGGKSQAVAGLILGYVVLVPVAIFGLMTVAGMLMGSTG